MKRNAFTLTEILVAIAILAIAALVLFPLFARARDNDRPRSCISNLKQISLGLLQYTQDYDDKLPPAKNSVGGWGQLVQPYAKSYWVFQCPSDNKDTDKTTDYFFNARLSGVSLAKLAAPTLTIALGDGAPDQPFDAHLSQLPATWLQNSNSPAHRHLDGANYAFADGHVKWFKPENITLDPPSAGQPTFLLGRSAL